MAYTALYRKWRPKTFNDVIGQEHIVRTLRNQITGNRVGHAYLFCGTRGTGKTSTAKIFAKAVNCMSPIEGNPCNTCDICKAIDQNRSMNIIEIDAASNNGVDNIREIREEVKYTPTEGRYKVYIIDEVHMLSTGAFNALLKTLEEPPSHVIFILATTEPHKIPATILSRCQRYDFKRISLNTIADTLSYYLKEEGISADDKAVQYIAKVADGSMRDALSIMEQCIAFYLGETITIDKVLEILGAVDTKVLLDIVEALVKKDVKQCLDIVEKIMVSGRDLHQLVVDLVVHFRNLLIVKTVQHPQHILDMSEEAIHHLENQAKKINEQVVMNYISGFSELERTLKYASGKRILLEVQLMKLCQPSMNEDYSSILERINALEEKVKNGMAPVQTHAKVDQKKTNIPKKTIKKAAAPKEIKQLIEKWSTIVSNTSSSVKAFLTQAVVEYLEPDTLGIICQDEIAKKYLSQSENMSTIKNILEQAEDRAFNVNLLTQQEYQTLYTHLEVNDEPDDDMYAQLESKIKFEIKYE